MSECEKMEHLHDWRDASVDYQIYFYILHGGEEGNVAGLLGSGKEGFQYDHPRRSQAPTFTDGYIHGYPMVLRT